MKTHRCRECREFPEGFTGSFYCGVAGKQVFASKSVCPDGRIRKEQDMTPANTTTGAPVWTPEDDARLYDNAHLGKIEAAKVIGKSPSAVQNRASKLGISLKKRPAEPHDTGVTFAPDSRRDLDVDKMSVAEALRLAAKREESAGVPVEEGADAFAEALKAEGTTVTIRRSIFEDLQRNELERLDEALRLRLELIEVYAYSARLLSPSPKMLPMIRRIAELAS
jgi:hypothetical protein